MLKNKKSISIVGVFTLLLLSITAPAFSAAPKKQLTAPKSISVGFPNDTTTDNVTITWPQVANNSGYTVRIYKSPNVTKPFITEQILTGVTTKTFSFPYNNQYRVTVQTKGTGIFSTSPEGGKYSFNTNLNAVVTTQPSGAVNGTALTSQPVITIAYPSGHTVTGFIGNVVASLNNGTGTETLTGTDTVAAVAGIASFDDLVITCTAGNFTLTFTPVGASAVTSASFALTAGAASTIAINAGNNQSATAGTAVTTAPSVIVKDANNNPVSGVSVTFGVATGGGSLGSPATVTTGADGIATSPAWTLGTVAGGNTLSATSGSLSGSPLTFTATATYTISVAAIAGVTAPVTGATPVTTTTAGTGYTGTVTWSESPATFASGTVYTATITLTPTTGYTLQGVAADFFTVAGATTANNSANSGVITAVFPATSASSSYNIGATGPGGGTIFYYSAAGFNCGVGFTSNGSPTNGLCHYLEVAPSGWNTGADPAKVWAVPANTGSDVSGIADDSSAYNNALGIGLGYKNSDLIVTQNGAYNASSNDYAAGAARAYTPTVSTVIYSDWYLPTTAELNLLCQWARNVPQDVTTTCGSGSLNTGTGASGGFVGFRYWSSSEGNQYYVWNQTFSTGSQQGLNEGGSGKSNLFYVRPIRAF